MQSAQGIQWHPLHLRSRESSHYIQEACTVTIFGSPTVWSGNRLGIHQAAPMRAVVLHHLDLIVGRANLDDYLNYANGHLEQPQQMASSWPMAALLPRRRHGQILEHGPRAFRPDEFAHRSLSG